MWQPQGLYAKFILRQPTVFFGENAAFGLADFPARSVAVIHGSALSEAGRETLGRVFSGKAVAFLPRAWAGEPDLDNIRPTVRALEACRPDVILAVGGGSVIDGAKLCRVLYEFPYFSPERTRPDSLSFRTRFLAMPTTAGSGAEASSAAVYIDGGRKEMLVSHALQPEAAVFDPHFIKSAPEKTQLPMIADAAAHMIEGYVSVVENALADILAEEGLRLIYEELSRPWEDADALRLQYAAYLGGVVQNHRLVGAAHAAAHQLSADGYAHAEAVAMLLPATVETNLEDGAVRARYDALCARAGLGGTAELVDFLRSLVSRAGLSARQAELRGLLAARAGDEAFIRAASSDRGGRGNPLPLDAAYFKEWVGHI